MKYKFLQAVHMHGQDFPLGIHEVPEKVEKDSYFKMLLDDQLVVSEDSHLKVKPQETLEQRNHRLAKSLAPKAPPEKVEEKDQEEPEAEAKSKSKKR